MGKKKKHDKKKRKEKKVQPETTENIVLNGSSYPVLSAYWGLSRFLEPHETPFLNMLQKATPVAPPKPLTEQDVDAAQQAAEEIVRKHTK